MQEIEGEGPPLGTLDVAFHRDDIGLRPLLPEAPTHIPFNLDGQAVVMVDDVLYTGRTIRARARRVEQLRPTSDRAAGGDGGPRASGSCPSAPISWARTCPPAATKWWTPTATAWTSGRSSNDAMGMRGGGQMKNFPPKHLLSINDLGAEGIDEVCRLADHFTEVSQRPIPKVPALRGRTVAMLFYEDSTRTRLSFEVAARRLSADVMGFSVSASSVNKGESVRDTVHTISAMGPQAIVVRHRSAGVPQQVAGWTGASVINAGDGWHEHPTQALLDCYTIRDRLGSVAGRRIVIVGDIKHSRVARSCVLAFTALGAKVTLVAPPTLLPPAVDCWPVDVCTSPGRGAQRLRCGVRAAGATGAPIRGVVAVAAGVHRPVGLTVDRAARLHPKHW